MNRHNGQGSSRLGVWVGALSLCAYGCSGEAQIEESLRVENSSLLGSQSYDDCSAQQIDDIEESVRHGRIVARSTAFVECIAKGIKDGIEQFETGDGAGVFGPYSPAVGDPFTTFTPGERTAHALNMSNPDVDIQHQCVSSNCGDMCAWGDTFGGHVMWRNPGANPLYLGGLLHHELSHTFNYEHNNTVSMTTIMGNCGREVLEQSQAAHSSACAALSCAANEMALIKRYLDFSECECVPDTFSGENDSGDRFGAGMAAGDFDGDGYEDLAVGAPGETGSAGSDVGVIYIFRGSPYGLRHWQRRAQSHLTVANYFTNPPATSSPSNGAGDEFGHALATGDFNDDGFADLAVSAPGKSNDAGVVYLLPGSSSGLDYAHGQVLDQRLSGSSSSVEAGDRFGASLAVGRFSTGTHDDLAVGVPFEVYSGVQAGVVALHLGSDDLFGTTGLVRGDGFIHQATGSWTNEAGDEFGATLATGNVSTASSADELIVGGPGEASDRGAVFVFRRGSSGWIGLHTFNTGASGARFGSAVAVGNFRGALDADIAVGAPGKGALGSLSIWEYSGDGAELEDEYEGTQFAITETRIGYSLAAGNLNANAFDDLLVGGIHLFNDLPLEYYTAIYYGASSGPVFQRNIDQHSVFNGRDDENTEGYADSDPTMAPEFVEASEKFGAVVALGNFDGDSPSGRDGIAVAAPGDRPRGLNAAGAGAVFVFAKGTHEFARKINQLNMRYGAVWPPY